MSIVYVSLLPFACINLISVMHWRFVWKYLPALMFLELFIYQLRNKEHRNIQTILFSCCLFISEFPGKTASVDELLLQSCREINFVRFFSEIFSHKSHQKAAQFHVTNASRTNSCTDFISHFSVTREHNLTSVYTTFNTCPLILSLTANVLG